MKKYSVEVTEKLSRVVDVIANNYDEAENKVDEMYNNQDIILDSSDFESKDYYPYPSREIKENINFTIDYDKENNNVIISNESSSGASYKCRNYEELIIAIKLYCDNYINYLEPKGEKIKDKNMER